VKYIYSLLIILIGSSNCLLLASNSGGNFQHYHDPYNLDIDDNSPRERKRSSMSGRTENGDDSGDEQEQQKLDGDSDSDGPGEDDDSGGHGGKIKKKQTLSDIVKSYNLTQQYKPKNTNYYENQDQEYGTKQIALPYNKHKYIGDEDGPSETQNFNHNNNYYDSHKKEDEDISDEAEEKIDYQSQNANHNNHNYNQSYEQVKEEGEEEIDYLNQNNLKFESKRQQHQQDKIGKPYSKNDESEDNEYQSSNNQSQPMDMEEKDKDNNNSNIPNNQQLSVNKQNPNLFELTPMELGTQENISKETIDGFLSVQFEAKNGDSLQNNIRNYLTEKNRKFFEIINKISNFEFLIEGTAQSKNSSDLLIKKDMENIVESSFFDKAVNCFDYGNGNHCQVTFDNNKTEIDKFFNDIAFFFLNTEEGSTSLYLHDDKQNDPKKQFILAVKKEEDKKILTIDFNEKDGNSDSNNPKTIVIGIVTTASILFFINGLNKKKAKQKNQQNLQNLQIYSKKISF
jgi:hypothetical protein